MCVTYDGKKWMYSDEVRVVVRCMVDKEKWMRKRWVEVDILWQAMEEMVNGTPNIIRDT